MKITIINGTNRIGNKSQNISHAAHIIARKLGYSSYVVTLENFTELFRGKYLTLDSASLQQCLDIEHMIQADVLLFVVPIYHHGIPSSLKNFLDLLDSDEAFNNKVIGFISSNKRRMDGVNQTIEVLNGILSYRKLHSFIVPRVTITDHDNIDKKRLEDYIHYCLHFVKESHIPHTYIS